ncbi:hypothetical protein T05_2142 [Trichinella murrelli]|uniref:Uncharacterized protein n=1 Tax=Trichinella murrelli TaxID=144512 RepID=A0A0V0T104_9BILA|nr:hypothetical protein T05_2142 [Trichinella murrelli]
MNLTQTVSENLLNTLDRTVFGAVTFSSSSVVSLIIRQISLSQASSVSTHPDNVLLLVAVSTFPVLIHSYYKQKLLTNYVLISE